MKGLGLLALGLLAGASASALQTACCESHGVPVAGTYRGTTPDRQTFFTINDGLTVASETFEADGRIFTIVYKGTPLP